MRDCAIQDGQRDSDRSRKISIREEELLPLERLTAIWVFIALEWPQHSEPLWRCDSCNLWWLSEPKVVYRWQLVRLTTCNNLAEQRIDAPAWNVCGPSPGICLECGGVMMPASLSHQDSESCVTRA